MSTLSVETFDSSLLLLHTDRQTEFIAHDTGVECTPELTEYCFFLLLRVLSTFIFHSRCWPIIHHSGRGGPLKSCLFS